MGASRDYRGRGRAGSEVNLAAACRATGGLCKRRQLNLPVQVIQLYQVVPLAALIRWESDLKLYFNNHDDLKNFKLTPSQAGNTYDTVEFGGSPPVSTQVQHF